MIQIFILPKLLSLAYQKIFVFWNQIFHLKNLKIKSKCSKKERAVVVGAPNGVFPIILDSYISKYKIEKEEIPFKEIDSDSEIMMLSQMFLPGHSGSPVISKDGKVCGIVFAASNAGYGGFAMSGREIISFINSYSDF